MVSALNKITQTGIEAFIELKRTFDFSEDDPNSA